MTTRGELETAFDDTARADVERILRRLHEERQVKNTVTRAEEKDTKVIKEFLERMGEREIVDGEAGVAAWFEDRAGSAVYDLLSFVASHSDAGRVLEQACAAGVLRIDDAALKRLDKGNGAIWIDALKRYRGPGEGSRALKVGTVEEMREAQR